MFFNRALAQYFAELTKELLVSQEKSKANIKSEFRISIYGRSASEWNSLADFVGAHNLWSDTNRYLIQIPRLYSAWKASKSVANVGQMMVSEENSVCFLPQNFLAG
jgi:AMP deaminase